MSQPLNIVEEEPWYVNGLRFKCTECGGCCTGSPGYVWVSELEISEMAAHLNISVESFMEKYVRLVDGKLSLLEDQKDPYTYDCVFLKDKKCQIYSVRPKQCRTFPWWPKNLKSEKDWEKAASFCEGINRVDAPIVPRHVIDDHKLTMEHKLK